MARVLARQSEQDASRPRTDPGARRGARRRVGFLIAGVQKAGTSSLFELLVQHPQLATSQPKELHFFDDDTLDWTNPDYRAYHRRTGAKKGSVVGGEATPSYLFWPGALERVQSYNPQMLLVLCFRDPIARAFSQWCMHRDRDDKRKDFGTAVRAVRPAAWPLTAPELGGHKRSYVARGYYGQQLRHALELFPQRQLMLIDYHVAFARLTETLDRLTDFLGVERMESPHLAHRRPRAAALAELAPAPRDIEMLAELYREDLHLFGALSSLDISAWPTARISAGSLDPAAYAAQLGGVSTEG